MLLQMYNNAEQGKWDKPRDIIITMNLAFTILNGIDLIVEFILIQLLNPDSEYSVLSKHKIGIVEEGYHNTDSSESEESIISSDSSSQKESRGKSRERIQFETQVKEVASPFAKKGVIEERPMTQKELEAIQYQEEDFL